MLYIQYIPQLSYGFLSQTYYNHFIGKVKQPVSDLEHKIFTKLKKKSWSAQATWNERRLWGTQT